MGKQFYLYGYVALTAIFCVFMVLTNIIGTKLFLLLPEQLPTGFGETISGGAFVVLTTGIVTYPFTFLFTDVCSEIWGSRRGYFMVTMGFVSSLVMVFLLQLGIQLPRADRFWTDAAGQYEPGTQVQETVAAGSTQLLLDDANFLSGSARLTHDGEALLAVMPGDLRHDLPLKPRFLRYVAIERDPARWDGRGLVELAKPLQDPIPAGSWVVPALRLSQGVMESVNNPVTVSVDRPRLLRATGSLINADGLMMNYTDVSDAGQIQVSPAYGNPAGEIHAKSGTAVAIAWRMDPSAMQKAYHATFASPGILLLSSMFAYLMAQLLDVKMFHFWRRLTGTKMLWLRNNGSTMVSQLVDTIIVNGIFLPVAFGMSFMATFYVIVAVYICKMILAWIDTPLIYICVWAIKKKLGFRMDEDVPDLLAR